MPWLRRCGTHIGKQQVQSSLSMLVYGTVDGTWMMLLSTALWLPLLLELGSSLEILLESAAAILGAPKAETQPCVFCT